MQAFGPSLYNFAYYGAAACLVNLFSNVEVTFALPSFGGSSDKDKIYDYSQLCSKVNEELERLLETAKDDIDVFEEIKNSDSFKFWNKSYKERFFSEVDKLTEFSQELEKMIYSIKEKEKDVDTISDTDAHVFVRDTIQESMKSYGKIHKNIEGIRKEVYPDKLSERDVNTVLYDVSFNRAVIINGEAKYYR